MPLYIVAENDGGSLDRVVSGSDNQGSSVTKNFFSLIAGYPCGTNTFCAGSSSG
eukprot:CAMPEP_0113420574 /NCGR_PEP_ID=MMETSP0013_2-20120614/27403_1 /TAXON_ID=2843 ORGANISM="Skeletonema costatum, Strain 1716" /NCGR_SAMPLE_ID=MMETSP0013_2 /ASSEMBLY_ACC=CAM_ASM_000158 /LENGTH=53 /DNA_ID=CAMNT_0000308067 /DNA_START=94 /DNA_END=251 /DNA_ORIENTATION=- /assembly_acc=CAM_ASM_000158